MSMDVCCISVELLALCVCVCVDYIGRRILKVASYRSERKVIARAISYKNLKKKTECPCFIK